MCKAGGRSYEISTCSPRTKDILALVLTLPAYGWGDEGHRTVARIAARHLTLGARLKIATIIRAVPASQDELHLRDLVGTKGTPSPGQIEHLMTTIATWPDHIPGGKKETAPWHFVDIGLFEGPDHMQERCGSGCVNQKIAEILQNLKSNKPLTRFSPDLELRFLVHFMGDIHQPLHAATNADAGANCVKATGLVPSNELHAVWDTALVELIIEGSEADAAGAIIKEFKDRQKELQALTDPDRIAADSFELARTAAYGKAIPAIPVIDHFVTAIPGKCDLEAPPEINNVTVDAKASYDNAVTLSLIRQQLYMGGVRLAALLNGL